MDTFAPPLIWSDPPSVAFPPSKFRFAIENPPSSSDVLPRKLKCRAFDPATISTPFTPGSRSHSPLSSNDLTPAGTSISLASRITLFVASNFSKVTRRRPSVPTRPGLATSAFTASRSVIASLP